MSFPGGVLAALTDDNHGFAEDSAATTKENGS